MKEVEINGNNDGESGGSENSGGFNLDTFKQNLVDNYNKVNKTSITIDNIIMPDAFIVDENLGSGEVPLPYSFIDTDLTQFLASICSGAPNVYPLYVKDSFDENNFYFGIYGQDPYRLGHHTEFGTQRNFDNMSGSYNGNLDLSNYEYLFDAGLV